MKNIWLYVGIIGVIILAFYLGYTFNKEEVSTALIQQKNTEESGKASTQDEASFAQKQQCAEYRNEIEKMLKEEYQWENESAEAFSELDEIWYSASSDSCLYSFRQTTIYSFGVGTVIGYSIVDYLQNTKLFGVTDSNNLSALESFELKKAELK